MRDNLSSAGIVKAPGSSRGQSLVEFALVLPLFLLIIVGIVEVADSMKTYITLVSASRDGARLGSKGLAGPDEIRLLVLTETERLRDPVNSPGDITVESPTIDGTEAISVEVCNDHTLIMSIPLVIPDNFRFCARTTMRVLD